MLPLPLPLALPLALPFIPVLEESVVMGIRIDIDIVVCGDVVSAAAAVVFGIVLLYVVEGCISIIVLLAVVLGEPFMLDIFFGKLPLLRPMLPETLPLILILELELEFIFIEDDPLVFALVVAVLVVRLMEGSGIATLSFE
jgi:hypothetical protein